ncbi:hypothetical protein; putative delta-aminolevulinic acid dehydratase [Acinetobacter baumannii SDF]|uniref:Uncharacterized protein n=2 Tax=Acinetobacter baumannii TaxID=470 RepID=B0VMJ3_ACIBS|nr:putative delta-aminolevulinic acid dehydratase [Acinetobacter baumannii]CAP02607.1 hypothetical protein; putative delta-aminolevulinic acid dehydratase [Acinetobacter baumannii SDF]
MNGKIDNDLYGVNEKFTRRLNENIEPEFNVDNLVQAVDVNLNLGKNDSVETKGLPGYQTFGWKKACEEINKIYELGVSVIALRFVSKVEDLNKEYHLFEKQLELIISNIDSNVRLIVDPFGLALLPTGQWGVLDEKNKFDYQHTSLLLEKIGETLSKNKVYGVVTLGRVPEEVALTKRGIEKAGNFTKIFSFSQNSETTTAYVYLDKPGKQTGQKILPGNSKEMTLWALIDIWCGTDFCVIKPLESYHLMSLINNLLEDFKNIEIFLKSKEVVELYQQNTFVKQCVSDIISSKEKMMEKCSKVKLGGYTVSGTTYMLALLAQQKNVEMARARLHEMWITAASAMDSRFAFIIDRNTKSYLEQTILH